MKNNNNNCSSHNKDLKNSVKIEIAKNSKEK